MYLLWRSQQKWLFVSDSVCANAELTIQHGMCRLSGDHLISLWRITGYDHSENWPVHLEIGTSDKFWRRRQQRSPLEAQGSGRYGRSLSGVNLVQRGGELGHAAIHVVQFFQAEQAHAKGHEIGRFVALQWHTGRRLQA
jgi:hypothetical protein